MNLVILKSKESHFWESCNYIFNAWEEGFSKLENQGLSIQYFEIERELNDDQVDFLRESEKNTIIFFQIDHLIFDYILEQLTDLNELRYIIPILGNLTVEPIRWKNLNSLLRGKKVCFLSASYRQCLQSELLLNGYLKRIPYPVKDSAFDNRPSKKEGGDKISVVYAGRITPQKNILNLIRSFSFAKKLNPKLELVICGNFHDRGYHLHHIDLGPTYRSTVLEVMESTEGVRYIGNLDQASLRSLFQNSDYQVSLSTYHDEDFGYSIAQGMAVGLKPILTNWGGHYDHSLVYGDTMIPVEINEVNIPTPVVTQAVKVFAAKSPGQELKKRIALIEKTKEVYSTNAWVKCFSKLLECEITRFQGITPLFQEYIRMTLKENPFKKDSELYEKIYHSYLNGKMQERFRL